MKIEFENELEIGDTVYVIDRYKDRYVMCPNCSGTPYRDNYVCTVCNGKGKTKRFRNVPLECMLESVILTYTIEHEPGDRIGVPKYYVEYSLFFEPDGADVVSSNDVYTTKEDCQRKCDELNANEFAENVLR